VTGPYAGDITPREAWDILTREPNAQLIDVRTPPEWSFVGVPDLSLLGKNPLFIPWALYPTMQINPDFAEHIVAAGVAQDAPLLFMCRSGARSRAAAQAMTARGFATCYNVASGFEGDRDGSGHRGRLAGWKADGLAWMQS
jgi:rhodanese-related sulfurtransferase